MKKLILLLAAAGLTLGLNVQAADVDDGSILMFNGDEQPMDAVEEQALGLDKEIMRPGDNSGRIYILCESRGYGINRCGGVPGRIRSVTLVRKLSFAPCIAGRSFGATERYVWVRQGCSGQFLVRYRTGWGGGH